MSGRINFDVLPTAIGWYGVLSTDGEREVWVGAAYWNGGGWKGNAARAYARSTNSFPTKEQAENWASDQPD